MSLNDYVQSLLYKHYSECFLLWQTYSIEHHLYSSRNNVEARCKYVAKIFRIQIFVNVYSQKLTHTTE